MRKRLRYGALVFTVAGLAGPLLRLATWPPASFRDATSQGVSSFVYDLVLYLWPAQLLGVAQPTVDQFLTPGVLYPIAGNLLLFVPLGLAVGAAANRPRIVLCMYVAVCAVLVAFGLSLEGFSPLQLSWFPLAVAMAFYGIPFWLVARQGARPAIAAIER